MIQIPSTTFIRTKQAAYILGSLFLFYYHQPNRYNSRKGKTATEKPKNG